MKKRLIGLLLSALLLLPILSSCSHEAVIVPEEVPIYTLYTIADTTPEALRAVELALNRILFYRQKVCIDIVAVSEDEYDELIASKLAEMDAIEAAKKSKGSSSSATSSEANPDYVLTVSGTLTGEDVLDMLENGQDVHPRTNRFDIFLVRGYDKYFELATQGKLAAFNEKLSAEAKVIKDYLHSSLLTAATINKKIYGVPTNGAIGDYKYIVFDKELLEKYNFEAKTMITVDDLNEYLQVIQENEPDVVPLKNTVDTRDYSFMFEDGFPFYVDKDNNVLSTYELNEIPSYYAKLARFRANGYFTNAQGSSEGRFAVTFVTGDESTIEELEKESGQNLVYNVYANPVVTNESAIKSIYCIHKSVASNDLTNIAKALAEIYTDPAIQNLLTYGVENVNYRLDDNGQVVMLNDDYRINPDYAGNKLITYTRQGEDPNKWLKIKEQNKLSTASRAIGFEFVPKTVEGKDGKTTVAEPNYKTILREVTAKYYPKFMDGSIVELDMEAVMAESVQSVMEELRDQLKRTYQTNLVAEYTNNVRKQITSSAQAKEIRRQAEETVMNELRSSVRSKLQSELTTKYRIEYPDATNEELLEMVEAELTEALIDEHLYDDTTVEKVQKDIDDLYESEIVYLVNDKVSDYLSSDAFQIALDRAVNSPKFNQELNALYSKNGDLMVDEVITEIIADAIRKAAKAMIEDYNKAIEEALDKFAEENSEALQYSKEEIFAKIGYYEASEDNKDDLVPAYSSGFEFVYKEKIQRQFNALYPLPNK